MSSAARRMIYPYTLTAKIVQFPLRWFIKENSYIKGLMFAMVVAFPAIYKIDRAVNSPENKRKWAGIRAARDHTHFDPPHE